MNKFTFEKNIKTAAFNLGRKGRSAILNNPDQWVDERARTRASEKRETNVETRHKEDDYLDSPFVLVTGDPSYHPVSNPDVEQPSYEFIHRSVPKYSGQSPTGEGYARGLKRLLLESKDWEPYKISKADYAANPEIVRRAPFGIEAFRPAKRGTAPSQSAALLVKNTQQVEKERKEKGRSTNNSLSPNSLESIVNTYGADSLSRLMTQSFGGPEEYKTGSDLCVCGKTEEQHGDAKHEFIPQGSKGNNNTYLDRLKQSPLLKTLRPAKGEKSAKGLLPVFDDDVAKGTYMPMVHASIEGDKFVRYKDIEEAEEGRKIGVTNNYDDRLRETQKKCPCGDGKINHGQYGDNSAFCRSCQLGVITEKEITTADGKTKLVPHTIGLGGGKLKNADPSDPQESFDCNNCNSSNGEISLTPDNVCPTCGGTKVLPGDPQYKQKGHSAPTWLRKVYNGDEDHKYTGMGRFALKLKESAPISGVDAWAAHRDPNCTTCKTDNYVSSEGTPCECRIRKASDASVLPPGTKIIHKKGFFIPERYMLETMKKQYPDDSSNPHEWHYMPWAVDPTTGKSGAQSTREGLMNDRPRYDNLNKSFIGIVSKGIRPPKEVIDRLNEKSKKHWSAPNAHFTAPSQDLEAVLEELKNSHTWPDIVANRDAKEKPVQEKVFRRNPKSFAPAYQKGVAGIEKVMSSLPDAGTGRYNVILDNMYDHLSNNNQEEFRKHRDQLVGMVNKFNPDQTHSLQRELSGLPISA